ncbi:FAD:protein FMN transferase [Geodermatophilus ruber]|uniref:FAD:protein FMN transferase n=1 Tax=Geodermatophilus ruber TaxID=504800 RepID=A0A1I4DWZ2_9ACTN|nr:FAD:protein FMN transferase [Geodermatophilus ruber]SFK98074.1 thiamine biosynthesis lipoprotein [Geodermatophilus ruber]
MIAAADWTAWTCAVRVAVTDSTALDAARAEVTAVMAEVDRAASRFRADSELAAVEASDGSFTRIGPLLTDLLAAALRAARLTDGDVDPTVGGSLCGLGYDRDLAEVSLDGGLAVRPAPGWRTIELDVSRHRVRVPAGTHLDLGATAKAQAADLAARAAARTTGAGCLVAIGGDVSVAGPAPAGGWRIRVEDVTGDPSGPPVGPWTVVTVREGGLATSSVHARRWKRGGMQLHHVVDPRTGLPPVSTWRTVSVAAASCTDANIASTAALVRQASAVPWLRARGLPARLVRADGALLTLGGWPAEERAA